MVKATQKKVTYPIPKKSPKIGGKGKTERFSNTSILKPKPQPKKYKRFKDVTESLSGQPGNLKLHPTASAPTAEQIRDEAIKARQTERTRYFGVPIKIYEPDKNDAKPQLTDEDREELLLYGSRVVMNEEGRVLGLEVRKDLKEQNKTQAKSNDYCQCIERQYEVSRRLQKIKHVRRVFMAKILIVEAILRLPALALLYVQCSIPAIHDFMYNQTVFMCAICVLLFGSRIVTISCSNVGRYEPCRSVMAIITALSYGFNCCLFSATVEKYSASIVQINEYKDGISLAAYKKKSLENPNITFPYLMAVANIHITVYNIFLSLILVSQTKCMNEYKNGFLLVILVLIVPIACATFYTVDSVIHVREPLQILWHATQLVMGTVVGFNWAMFRFYTLQRLIKGKVMPVDEFMHYFIALMVTHFW